MASEIRVNRLSNRSGLSTITFANGGVQFSGITTFANGDFRVGTGATILNPSTNEMQFHTGGSNRLTINNEGLNLGIGSITVGDATFTGSVSIGKTLTYEDVKNVDSVGVVTARTGVKITGGDFTVGTAITASSVTGNVTNDVGITTYSGSAVWFKGATANKDMYWSHASGATVYKDNAQILMGDSSDMQISHDGSNSYIKDTGTGFLSVQGSEVHIRGSNDENGIKVITNGRVELYHDNVKTFETVSGGSKVTGDLDVTGHIDVGDGVNIKLGADDDLKIWHDGGGHNYIRGTDSTRNYIQHGTHNAIITYPSSSVELYFNNSKKLETTNTGVTVTGSLTATSFVGGLPITSGADNRVITASSASAIQGESNLTFNGSRLSVTGDVYVTGSQNAKLTTNQLIFDRAGGYSYIDQIDNAGSLAFRVTASNTIALLLDSSAQATFGSNLIIPDAIQHAGDLDCKIRFPGSDTISFETASNERLRIDSSGHLGLGISPSDIDSIGRSLNIASSTGGAIYLQDTDAPTTKFAAISYNGGTAALQIHAHHSASYIDLGTNGTERLRITSAGRVALGGETSPSHTFHVRGEAENCIRWIRTGSSVGGSLYSDGGGSEIVGGDGVLDNTGIYLVTDTRIDFRVNGSERLRLGTNSNNSSIGSFGTGSSHLNNCTTPDRASFKVGGRLHVEGAFGHNAMTGLYYNCYSGGNDLFYSGTYTPSGGDGRAAAITMRYGGVAVMVDNSSTAYSPTNQITTMQTALNVDREGRVTKPLQPSFHARRTNSANSTSNPLVFDSVHHNNGSHYKSSGTDQGKFVAPVAGVYLFYWCAIKTNNGSVCRLYIKKNGSNIYSSMHLRLQEDGTYSNGSMQAILNLSSGDKVHISLEAGSIHGNEYTHFGGYLIG